MQESIAPAAPRKDATGQFRMFAHAAPATHTAPAVAFSSTSRDAAARAPVGAAALILVALREAGPRGATDAELQNRCGLEGNTERPRRQSLQRRGLIRDSGRTRPTPAGRQAVVWVLANDSEGGNRG